MGLIGLVTLMSRTVRDFGARKVSWNDREHAIANVKPSQSALACVPENAKQASISRGDCSKRKCASLALQATYHAHGPLTSSQTIAPVGRGVKERESR